MKFCYLTLTFITFVKFGKSPKVLCKVLLKLHGNFVKYRLNFVNFCLCREKCSKVGQNFVQNFNKSSQYLVNVFLVHHSQFQWNLILFWMTEIFLFNQNLELPNFACWVHCKSKLISFIKKTPSFSNLR